MHLLSQESFQIESSCSNAVQVGVEARQLDSAMSTTKGLLDVFSAVNRAEVKLQHQFSELCTAAKCEQMEDDLRGMIERNRFAAESFRSAFNAPALLPNIRLDFDSKDGNEHFSTPEEKLRHPVFCRQDHEYCDRSKRCQVSHSRSVRHGRSRQDNSFSRAGS